VSPSPLFNADGVYGAVVLDIVACWFPSMSVVIHSIFSPSGNYPPRLARRRRSRVIRLSQGINTALHVGHTSCYFGDRCFVSALWNTLPAYLQQCDSLQQFKRLLKTYLFGVSDRSALWHFCQRAPFRSISLTYLPNLYVSWLHSMSLAS